LKIFRGGCGRIPLPPPPPLLSRRLDVSSARFTIRIADVIAEFLRVVSVPASRSWTTRWHALATDEWLRKRKCVSSSKLRHAY